MVSKNVPLAGMLICGDNLMSSSPDFWVLVPVEFSKSVVNLVLESWWAAVADDVQNPGPDPDVIVVNKLQNSVPEDFDVPEYLAWTQLLNSFKSDIVVLVMGVLKDDLDILSVPAFVDNVLLMNVDLIVILLPVIPTLWHNIYLIIAAVVE